MRLSCMNALLLVGALTTACHETTSPPKEPGTYSLESFNNQPLPAVVTAGGLDTTTLVSATLFLDGAANATVIAHSREVHPSTLPRDAIDTTLFTYRIVGDSIAFYNRCPYDALCALPPFGKTTSSTLTLYYGGSPGARPVYFYRLLASDPH
jgi:hypothetical protein